MLVVTANWEITDGTLWSSGAGAFVARFVAGVRLAAVRCGWRADALYAPIPRIDVILAGDTFDWVASQAWLGAVRPWHRGQRACAIHDGVVAASLVRARGVLAPLLRAARRGISVPRADRHGRPVVGESVVVPVGLTMLSGNLDGGCSSQWPRALATRLGVGIGDSWSSPGIEVAHGHALDPLWAPPPGASAGPAPTLGALLRVDLLGQFALRPAIRAIDERLRRRFLADLAAAHPLATAGVAHRWLTTLDSPAAVRDAWLASVEAWHRCARRTGIGLDLPFDPLDAVATRLAAIDLPRPGMRPPRPCRRADPLAEALLPGPVPPAEGAVTSVLGHLPVAESACRDPDRSLICLGRDPAREAGAPAAAVAVREIGPPTALVGDPPAVLIGPGGDGRWRGTALGDPVAEWESGTPLRAPHGPRDAGGWVIEAA
jgi:hypothetical protein